MFFFFQNFTDIFWLSSILIFFISYEKSEVVCLMLLLYVIYHFSLTNLRMFSPLFLVFSSFTVTFSREFIFYLSSDLVGKFVVFIKSGEFLVILLKNFAPFSPPGPPFVLFQCSLRLSSFLFLVFYFSLFFSWKSNHFLLFYIEVHWA